MTKKDIEDIYPLSPMQQGILFHSLLTPDSGAYLPQVCMTLDDLTNIDAFQSAWQIVLQRNSALRTAFQWELREQPFQVVYRHVELPWEQQDWQEFSPTLQQQKLTTCLRAQRQVRFDLKTPPLFRLTLIQIAKARYYLIWTQHHLIVDGWSAGVILKQVIELYRNHELVATSAIAASRPYGDYIKWLQQQDLAAAQAFWRKQLQGFDTPNSLLIAQNTQKLHTQPHWLEQQITLSASVTEALKSLGQKHHFTLNTLLQGAFSILLSRYCNTDDIVFGATTSGRPPLPGIESMVGLFINTLPVRVQVADQEFLIPWLQQLQQRQAAAFQYEFASLLDIQTWSEIPHGTALFEWILVYENYPVDATLQSQAGLQIENISTQEWTSFPLTVVASAATELNIKVKYDRHQFNEAVIARFLANFQTLLTGIATHPQQRLGELPILTTTEQELLTQWNSTSVDYPQYQCIHELFAAQVERTPDAIAVSFAHQQLTYQELNSQAQQLAAYLQTLGVCSEVVVGICLERSLEMAIAILAVLKAGGAYLPLDPAYPPARLAYMRSDAQVAIVISQADSKLQVEVDSILPPAANSVLPTLDNSIYVIYTSGSTGLPKGVINTHRSLVNRLNWMQSAYQLTASDRVLQKTPFSFDVSVWEFFWTWLNGACLVIAQPGRHQDSVYLQELIAKEQITTIHFVPSMLQVFLEEPGTSSSLQRVFCSGEALSIDVKNHFFNRFQAQLHNLYGPTEAAIDVTYFDCKQLNEIESASVPIGRPIDNIQTYILDANQRQVPIGVAGELYIAGVGLARGYLNLPDLTAARFVPNSIGDSSNSNAGCLFYKTGDRARYLEDGNIEFLGRIDHQVKIRGLRIELGEIEAVLTQHSQIQTAVVITKEDVRNEKTLVAYIVPQTVTEIESEVRSFLETKLPNYMIPNTFVVRESLPLTPNGKLDRQALIADDIEVKSSADVLPRNPTEEIIAAIWQEVLKLERISVEDNFFALGGNSLLATRINSRLRKAFQLELPLSSLFEKPTIAALAVYIQTLQMTTQLQPVATTANRKEIAL